MYIITTRRIASGEPSHRSIPNAPFPLRDLGPLLASTTEPADLLLRIDEVGCGR